MAATNEVKDVVEEVSSAMDKVQDIDWVQVQEIGVAYGTKIIAAIIILVIGFWVAKLIRNSIGKLMNKRKVDPTLTAFTMTLLFVAMKVFVVVAALEALDIKTTSFIAVLGAAGLAVGLALQGSLSNFASGVLMIIFKPFKVGNFVEAGGAKGFVKEISIFTTIIDTMDNKQIIVPNAKVMGDNITNYNANRIRRVDLVAGISYSDDIDKAKSVLEAILADDDRVLKDPAPTVAVVEMGDSSVNLVVRPWCTCDNYWDVYFDVTEAIKKSFDESGITIPFPQRDVHLYEHKAE